MIDQGKMYFVRNSIQVMTMGHGIILVIMIKIGVSKFRCWFGRIGHFVWCIVISFITFNGFM